MHVGVERLDRVVVFGGASVRNDGVGLRIDVSNSIGAKKYRVML